ncbi:MAG: hypothetical protein ACK5PI_04475 [Acetobacteraceae bacterium]
MAYGGNARAAVWSESAPKPRGGCFVWSTVRLHGHDATLASLHAKVVVIFYQTVQLERLASLR